MNHSIYSIDRMTHLKVVVIALALVIALISIVMSSRIISKVDTVAVVKAGTRVAITSSNLAVTR
ncbi:MAG: hypothetical protein KGL35_30395 [Bradyrhizobium sp.]|nr:hypothetical protein [Pseudomonadota bacterium]MDE2472911.1 hypothetical protein [Bradyrhizobium sp.]